MSSAVQVGARPGNPMNIVNMVLFLCSDKASFITCKNICIDDAATKLMISAAIGI